MNELMPVKIDKELTFQEKHQFSLMIILAILVSSVLVAISMTMYYSSGAAQLDLSRSGYKDVRAKVKSANDFQDYSDSGAINQTTINEFKTLYNKQIKDIKSVDAFGGDPLKSEALGMGATANQ